MTTKNIKSGLYIVATPIGNLSDITFRAIDVLKNSDLILCEDTRTSKKLFSKYGINTKTESFHKFNEHSDYKLNTLIDMLKSGKIISIVSDAGMPMISDPGYPLLVECRKNDIYYTVIPGASSVLAGLVLSTFPMHSFYFGGFLPNKSVQRLEVLKKSQCIKSSLVFFESANRLEKCLKDLNVIVPNNKIAIVKEITKLFEVVHIGKPADLINMINNGEIILKGEIVLVISNNDEDLNNDVEDLDLSSDEFVILVKDVIKNNNVKNNRQIAKIISDKINIPSKDIYNKIVEIKDKL